MHDPYSDAVQDAWPERTCHGCGPANADGIQLKSYLSDDGEALVAEVDHHLDTGVWDRARAVLPWRERPQQAYASGVEEVMNGGYIATLVDCHAMWTAITFAYDEEDRPLLEDPPIYFVTGELDVTYHAPTPMDEPVHLEAWVEEYSEDVDRATVHVEGGPEGETTFEGEVTAIRQDDWIENG